MIIKDKTISEWIMIFQSCHNQTETGFLQWCWPDGECLNNQIATTVFIFNLIKSEASKAMAKE